MVPFDAYSKPGFLNKLARPAYTGAGMVVTGVAVVAGLGFSAGMLSL